MADAGIVEIANIKDGVKLAGPVTALAATAAAAVVAWTQSVGVQQVGTKSVRLIKAKVNSAAVTAAAWVHVGTGVGIAFVDLVPPMRTVDNMDTEYDLDGVEAFANVTAWVNALPAGAINLQLIVEERG